MNDDLDRIMAVMAVAFDPVWGEAWSRAQVGDSLAFSNIHYRLIGEDGLPPAQAAPAAGFTLVRAAPGEEELLLIAVVPALRSAAEHLVDAGAENLKPPDYRRIAVGSGVTSLLLVIVVVLMSWKPGG